MKKITLNHLVPADKSSFLKSQRAFTLYLGNGNTVSFTNETKAKAYQVEVNETLNFNLVILNKIYKDVHSHYRDVWFLIKNGPNGTDGYDSKISEYFNLIDKDFDMMVTRSHWPNGNHYVFKYFNNCLGWMDSIIRILQKVEMNRNAYAQFKMLKVILLETEAIRKEINELGFDRSTVNKNVMASSN